MILIGTSGFSYDDWKGHFYPESMTKKDMLGYYARQFKTTEVNSSYYAIPGAASFAGMARKTPDDFEFVVKAHKDMTHGEELQPEVFDIFRGATQPLREAGKFGCMLAQFPWSFKRSDENIGKLREFRELVGDLPTVIEFRNADWVNDETFDLLRELDLGFCSVDEPHLKGLMPPVAAATSNIGYVRFHGRNAKNWWHHEEAYQRYDYLYNEEELGPWAPKVRDLEADTSKTYVFFNNHYQGKSAQNARMFARLLGMELPLAEAIQTSEPGGLPF
jgi:uncharacterized protein YecE (DUF72 family)